jgi:hypothetical protein
MYWFGTDLTTSSRYRSLSFFNPEGSHAQGFSNYLSDAKSEKLPLWVVVGVSLALDDPGRLRSIVETIGHTLVSEIEHIDLEIGRHECAQWELARSMAALRNYRFEIDQKRKDEKIENE